MAFVDELKIRIKAGDGGDGVVRFHREKYIEFGGPSGGDGGNGGDVYIVGSKDMNLLFKYRNKKEFRAQNGENGRKESEHGRSGDDLEIPLPVGTSVRNLETDEEFELLEEGQRVLILKGGRGGFGNERFKSSTNQTPQEFTEGTEGEEAEFDIEIRLIAEVGLVGLPNAGKSSLLNALTNADAKVGNFNFTTLDPNLGSLYGTIIADIPGIIEGASGGKGLGYKFLRHIKRTKKLLHCISVENESLADVYNIIRKELEQYSVDLGQKDEVILLTKVDLVSEEELNKKIKEIKDVLGDKGQDILTVSILDDELLDKLKQEILNRD